LRLVNKREREREREREGEVESKESFLSVKSVTDGLPQVKEER